MERMKKEELKKGLEKLKDFKVYVFEGDVYVKAEDYKKIAIENKKLNKELELVRKNTRANVETLDNMYGENVDLKKENKELEEENETLKDNVEFLHSCLDDRDESIAILQEENKKLNEFKEKREETMFYFKALAERVEPINSKEAEELQKFKKLFEKLYREELHYLEEENKNLKKENEELQKYLCK